LDGAGIWLSEGWVLDDIGGVVGIEHQRDDRPTRTMNNSVLVHCRVRPVKSTLDLWIPVSKLNLRSWDDLPGLLIDTNQP
jgi:hypothetical protein